MEKKMETTIVYWGHIGILEKTLETTIVYWGFPGILWSVGFLEALRPCIQSAPNRNRSTGCTQSHPGVLNSKA